MKEEDYDEEDIFDDDTPRFAYEVAEAVLDEFADGQSPCFRRAYQKLKFMITAYGYADYGDETVPIALSRGWEDLQIAATGRGEAAMTGALLQCWNEIPEEEEKSFQKALKKAFKSAEKETPKEATRLYQKEYRTAGIVHPDEGDGYDREPILPCSGVRLREWAEETEEDPDKVEEIMDHFFWVEFADRNPEEVEEDEGLGLRLINGGKEDN